MLAALGERDRTRRDSAIGAAARTADPVDLIDLVAQDEHAGRRNAALEALARGGQRSVPSLIRALRHPDPEVIMFAASTLGRTRDPAAIPHLVRLLDQDDPNVAQAALDSLARLRATVALHKIVALLDRDPWLRFAAVHALGELGDANAVHVLLPLLGDETVRETVIEALGKIGSVEALSPLAVLLNESSDSTSFAACLRAIGNLLEHQPNAGVLRNIKEWAAISTPEAFAVHQRLIRVLSRQEEWSDDVEVKSAAAAIIRALRIEPLYTTLVLAGRDPLLAEVLRFCAVSIGAEIAPSLQTGLALGNANVRVLACQTVAALGLTGCAPQVAALLDDPDDAVRATAVHTLGRLDHTESIPAIIRLLVERSSLLREAARAALGRMDAATVSAALLGDPLLTSRGRAAVLEVMQANPHPSQAAFLDGCLADRDATVRRLAVAAVARQHDDASARVQPLLHDEDAGVRLEAVKALGTAHGEQVSQLLLEQIERDPDTRAEAIRSIGLTGSARAIGRLVVLLSRCPPTHPAEIEALAALREPASEPIFVRLIAHPDPDIRLAAIQALRDSESTTALRHVLKAMVRDSDPRVRRVVADAVSRCRDTKQILTLCMDSDPAVATAARRHLEDLESEA